MFHENGNLRIEAITKSDVHIYIGITWSIIQVFFINYK